MRHDAWRKQKVREYKGPWLPSPIETEDDAAHRIDSGLGAEARYETLESVSFAFLLALEALTPKQRAVLLLRDVYDYSVRETAGALGLSEPAVKTTHHRARKAMKRYDADRRPPSTEVSTETKRALERFLDCFKKADAKAMEELLAEDVQSIHDAGGEFIAAGVPIEGREAVARFYTRILPDPEERIQMRFTMLNGLPGILAERPAAPPGLAPRWAHTIELDAEGRTRRS